MSNLSKNTISIFYTLKIISLLLVASGPGLCAIDDSEIDVNSFLNEQPRRPPPPPPQESHPIVNYGWRLVILPSPGNTQNILVRRIDEILNLTCTAEYFDDGSVTTTTTTVNPNSTAITTDLTHDQLFKLTWHLPIRPQNSKTRVSFIDSHNSKQLIVEHLKESDAGEYECQAKALSDNNELGSVAPFVEYVKIVVKPKKGSCSDPFLVCSSGECIAKRFLCDGFPDCKDKSDEGYETCGTYHPCEGKLKCDDGRCMAPHFCCDPTVNKNCSFFQPDCCRQLTQLQLHLETPFSSQPHHYNEMGFLQTTIYTVVGCSLAFMLIITIMVVAICRVHLKRTAMAHMSHPQMRSQQNPFGDILFNSTGGLPYTSAASGLLVTYNINNGVQFMAQGRPVNPPPYSELARIPPREGPPPPYSSVENLAIDNSPSPTSSLNPNPGSHHQSQSHISSEGAIIMLANGDNSNSPGGGGGGGGTSQSQREERERTPNNHDNDAETESGVTEPLIVTTRSNRE